MLETIASSAELAENAILPCLHEVHADPTRPSPCLADLPPALQSLETGKSPARWAYERLIVYIRNFEQGLDSTHEVAMGFAGGEAGVLRIEGVGYFDPDLVTFFGSDHDGLRTQLIQHVSRLSVMLRAMPKPESAASARRIGFRLVRELDPPHSGDLPPLDAPLTPSPAAC